MNFRTTTRAAQREAASQGMATNLAVAAVNVDVIMELTGHQPVAVLQMISFLKVSAVYPGGSYVNCVSS